ncbi:glycosyltransferase family 2 protein [Intrasporangium sp.]|uniref:glycosyltransferase n=1 Tax=Intrasporangium sp. TaxID=1925024 RepID=UPI003222157E
MARSQPLTWAFLVLSAAILVVSSLKLVYVPLAVWFELRRGTMLRGARALRAGPQAGRHPPGSDDFSVSVIVPAYNEAVVLRGCIESILRTRHPGLEIVIVDDGSTDGTPEVMNELAGAHEAVRVVSQPNAGKGAALNRGIAQAGGNVLVFVDADGVFSPMTIPWLLTGLRDPHVGAVCGDDRPVNLDRVQTRLLSVISHLGTGLARRALSVLHCLPIVSGNIGAFRADLVRQVGGFRTDTVGEDLELTWRIYEAGYRVCFEPRAIVLAESPSTVRALWRQRVRWSRGLLQTVRHHWRMLGNPAHGVFGIFLGFNAVTMIVVPVLQLLVLLLLAVLVPRGMLAVDGSVVQLAAWLGLVVTVGLTVLGIALNAAWRDLGNLWTVPLWPLYSVFMALTMATALVLEARGGPAAWNKAQRTGVVTEQALRGILRREEA